MDKASRPRTLLVAGAALAGLIVGVGGTVAVRHLTHHTVAHDAAPPTTTPPAAPPLVGTVELLGSTSSVDANINMTHDNSCFGRGPYSYLDASATVTIADPESGRVLGTSRLTQGTLLDGMCQFRFVIPKLPSLSTYSVRVDGRMPTVVSQVRVQQGLILRTGNCCVVPTDDPGQLS